MAVRGGIAGIAHRLQNGAQRIDALEGSQAGRVGAGDIDDQIVGPSRHSRGRVAVVLDGVGQRRDLGLADVGAHDDGTTAHGRAQVAQASSRLIGTGVVEPHAIPDRPHLRVAPHAGLVIAVLGAGREGADLDEAEAEHVHALDGPPLLVHAGGQAEQAGHGPDEGTALVGAGNREDRPAPPQLSHRIAHERDSAGGLDGLDAHVMNEFGIDTRQDGLVQQVVEHTASVLGRTPARRYAVRARRLRPRSS